MKPKTITLLGAALLTGSSFCGQQKPDAAESETGRYNKVIATVRDKLQSGKFDEAGVLLKDAVGKKENSTAGFDDDYARELMNGALLVRGSNTVAVARAAIGEMELLINKKGNTPGKETRETQASLCVMAGIVAEEALFDSTEATRWYAKAQELAPGHVQAAERSDSLRKRLQKIEATVELLRTGTARAAKSGPPKWRTWSSKPEGQAATNGPAK